MRVNRRRLVRAAILLAVIAGIAIGIEAWRQSYSYRVARLVASVQTHQRPWYLAWLGSPPKPANKIAVIEALVALGPPAEAAIADQVANENEDSRFCAAAALTEIGTRRSVPALIEAIKAIWANKARARTGAAAALGKDDTSIDMMCLALGHIGDPRASDVLLGDIDRGGWSPDWVWQPRAIALCLIGEPRAAVPYTECSISLGASHCPGPSVDLLWRVVKLHGLSGVRGVLDNPDANVANRAAWMLADCADEEVVTFFLQRIKDGKFKYYDEHWPVSAEHSRDVLCRLAEPQPGDKPQIGPDGAIELLKFIVDDQQVLQTLRRLAGVPAQPGSGDLRIGGAEVLADARRQEGLGLVQKLISKGEFNGAPEAVVEIEAEEQAGNGVDRGRLARPNLPDWFFPPGVFEEEMSNMDKPSVWNANDLFRIMKGSGNLASACDRVAHAMARKLDAIPLWRRLMQPELGQNGGDSITDVNWLVALDKAGDGRGAQLLGRWMTDYEPFGLTPQTDPVYFRDSEQAINLLDRMTHSEAGRVLRGLLKDRRRSVRILAAGELGKRRDKEALPLLQAMLKHPDARLQYAARQAIRRINAPAPQDSHSGKGQEAHERTP